MKIIIRNRFLLVIVTCLLISHTAYGRGFGGGRGGGISRGGGMSRGGGISRGGGGISRGGSLGGSRPSYGGSRPSVSRPSVSRPSSFSGSRVGGNTRRPTATQPSVPGRGQSGSVSKTGPRGGTVTVGGARGGVRGPSGGAAGRVGGVKVEGPRGNTATKVGAGGVAAGKNGVAAGRVGGGQISTPGGRTISRGGAAGVARGPGGAAAGRVGGAGISGSRGSVGAIGGRGVATSNGFARYRGGAAVRGPRGGVAAGHRTVAVSRGTLHGRGIAVRSGFYHRHPGCGSWFRGGWYARYPHAWRAARWTAAGIWAATTWNSWYSWWGWPASGATAQPVYYDYGNTTVYEGDIVYQGGEQIATADEYYEQATEIAAVGQADNAPVAETDEWQSFGVFGLVQGDETEADKVLQIGSNKKGVIRGNYYDTLTDTTLSIEGSVDPKTQRAAWTVGDNKKVVYETGVGDLTKDETTLLIHFGKDKSQQWTMIRLEEPEDSAASGSK